MFTEKFQHLAFFFNRAYCVVSFHVKEESICFLSSQLLHFHLVNSGYQYLLLTKNSHEYGRHKNNYRSP